VPEPTPDPELTAFAASLARAAPDPGRLDRDGLLIRAGRAASVRQARRWAAAAAVLALVAAGEGLWLGLRPPQVVVVAPPPASAPEPPALSPSVTSPAPGPVARDDSAPPPPQRDVLPGGFGPAGALARHGPAPGGGTPLDDLLGLPTDVPRDLAALHEGLRPSPGDSRR
jgi:hypothetical protein